jgi:hypothetical protein
MGSRCPAAGAGTAELSIAATLELRNDRRFIVSLYYFQL